MLLSCPKRSIRHFLGSWCPWGHAHSFVTAHTSTAFTFYMRRIVLFSASQRHRAWDIRSQNWPLASVWYLAFIAFLGEYRRLPRKSRTGISMISTRSWRCRSRATETPRVRLVRQSKRGQLLYKQFVFRLNSCVPPTCFIHPCRLTNKDSCPLLVKRWIDELFQPSEQARSMLQTTPISSAFTKSGHEPFWLILTLSEFACLDRSSIWW